MVPALSSRSEQRPPAVPPVLLCSQNQRIAWAGRQLWSSCPCLWLASGVTQFAQDIFLLSRGRLQRQRSHTAAAWLPMLDSQTCHQESRGDFSLVQMRLPLCLQQRLFSREANENLFLASPKPRPATTVTAVIFITVLPLKGCLPKYQLLVKMPLLTQSPAPSRPLWEIKAAPCSPSGADEREMFSPTAPSASSCPYGWTHLSFSSFFPSWMIKFIRRKISYVLSLPGST